MLLWTFTPLVTKRLNSKSISLRTFYVLCVQEWSISTPLPTNLNAHLPHRPGSTFLAPRSTMVTFLVVKKIANLRGLRLIRIFNWTEDFNEKLLLCLCLCLCSWMLIMFTFSENLTKSLFSIDIVLFYWINGRFFSF